MTTTGAKQAPLNPSELANKVADEVRRSVDSAYGEVSRNVKRARRAAEDAIEDSRYGIKQYPFASVGVALAGGLLAGVLIGWLAARSND